MKIFKIEENPFREEDFENEKEIGEEFNVKGLLDEIDLLTSNLNKIKREYDRLRKDHFSILKDKNVKVL